MQLRYKNDEKILQINEVEQVPFLIFPKLNNTEIVTHGFSTKKGGVSTGCWESMNISTSRGDDPKAVEENRSRIARAIGVDAGKMVFTNQVHSTAVAVVSEKDYGKILPETDGMITNIPGLCLVTFFADCVPLYFVDPVRKAIGLSHSGWRGTVANMAQATIIKMQETFGTCPEDLVATIGPSICQDCYEVSEDVIVQFKEQYEKKYWDELFYEKQNGRYQLNLWKANEINMIREGIRRENIAVTNVCTCCNHEVLFSHRITGFQRGNLSAFLALKEG